MIKTVSKSFSLSNSLQKPSFFAVLMYSPYGNPRYFKFKRKYQQYGPCFLYFLWLCYVQSNLTRFNFTLFLNLCSCLLHSNIWLYYHFKTFSRFCSMINFHVFDFRTTRNVHLLQHQLSELIIQSSWFISYFLASLVHFHLSFSVLYLLLNLF